VTTKTDTLAQTYWERVNLLYDELEISLKAGWYEEGDPELEKLNVLRDSHRDLLKLVQDLRAP
jgi:hypothetical protein